MSFVLLVLRRLKKPIIFIDAYYDADGQALCPAATGFTHHINPWGDIEPCPVIQIATESIHDERPVDEVFNESDFLRDFRKTAAQHTRGCIVLERPDLIEALADRHGAKDATARKTAIAELQAANSHRSQYDPDAVLGRSAVGAIITNGIERTHRRRWLRFSPTEVGVI